VEAINVLAGRKDWARELLGAVADKKVPPMDLQNNTILRIRALNDGGLNRQIEAAWGKVRDQTPAEFDALIDRMRGALADGRGSFERGRLVFENQCAKCHKFEGKGYEVGPSLDGAARDIEYLLINVLDPNRVVGQPYFTRFAALKNGRIETGLLAAEDDKSITLKSENNALKVIAKKDIEQITVQEKSLMPEGLANNMTPQDFRDLIRYLMANPFLTDVAVAGPYFTMPVGAVDFEKPMQSKELVWTLPVVGPTGRIRLPAVKADGEGTSYVAAELTAPAKMRTQLQVGAGCELHVYLNGKRVYKGVPGKQSEPDQAGIDVELREATNRLLIAARYRGDKEAVFARLLDPERKISYPAVKVTEPRP
jgi:putative heme-binding domain-containing protein